MAFDGTYRTTTRKPSKATREQPSAFLVPNSKNEKIRSLRNKRHRVATTYAGIRSSCPTTCQRRQDGSCYAQGGHVGSYVLPRLENPTARSAPVKTARQEAAAIYAFIAAHGGRVPQDGARGGRDLRLHTVGDCTTPKAARILAAAAAAWLDAGGGAVWTYTHAWRDVAPWDWGAAVSVLASLDNAADASEAHKRGYAATRVVAAFPNGSRAWTEHGFTWIPCPAQTRADTGCADCRLCLDGSKLHARKAGIAFEAHGTKRAQLKRRLMVLS